MRPALPHSAPTTAAACFALRVATGRALPCGGSMAQKRKAKARPAKRSRPKRTPSKKAPASPVDDLAAETMAAVPPTETAEQALVGIAQDAVVILRRELAFRSALSMKAPGGVKMKDLVAMLKLLVDLVPTAMKGHEGQSANFDALTPEERVQFAALLSKVEYA